MGFTEETIIETKYGSLNAKYFKGDGGKFCLCVYKKPWQVPVFVRLHSGCLFAESLRANDCDCDRQLQASLSIISKEGGVVVYLFQEGRGLGLEGKIRALEVQRNQNVDTAKAFEELGFEPDLRVYTIALKALRDLGIPNEISLDTNNPNKLKAFEDFGFIVTRRHVAIRTNLAIRKYLKMKQKALSHYPDE